MSARPLPPGHSFSQSSLAALDRCPRRYYLHHLRQLAWPAPLTGADQEWEVAMRRGQLFHLLVQQHSAGVAVEATVAALDDPELATWWRRYRECAPSLTEGTVCYSEVEVTAALGRHVLVAKCDLVACSPEGRIRIVDWKTGTRLPDPERQRQSWQTVAYRFAVVEGGVGLASAGLSEDHLEPEQVELVYWHAAFPDAANTIPYNRREHEVARRQLLAAVESVEVRGLDEGAYARAEQVEECRRCPYRSYCDRGREPEPDLDWEDEAAEPIPWLLPPEED